jgi:hypothetical protein
VDNIIIHSNDSTGIADKKKLFRLTILFALPFWEVPLIDVQIQISMHTLFMTFLNYPCFIEKKKEE